MLIQVIERAVGLLRLLRDGERGLTELARETGLQPTTARNILRTLEDLELVRRVGAGKYVLGDGLATLAEPLVRNNTLQRIAQETTDALARETREAVMMSVLYGTERFIIANTIGVQTVGVIGAIRIRQSPFNTVTGRVLVAHLPEEKRRELIEQRGVPGTEWPEAETGDSLEREAARIREAGIARLRYPDGQVQTLAVPVFGPDDTVWAALGIHLPYTRYQEAPTRLEDALRREARHASDALRVAYGQNIPKPS